MNIKDIILEGVKYYPYIEITPEIIRDEFPGIPLPDTEELEARIQLSLRNLDVSPPISPDAGLSSYQRLKKWCKENSILIREDYSRPDILILYREENNEKEG